MNELYEKLEQYSKKNIVPMHMPGHKRNVKMLGNKLPYEIDITEIEDFDDLHHAEGVIKQIENKAKKIYESKRSFILVNGSTCGLLAGIRSVVNAHDKILVARNCHKSIYNAIELNFLDPIYLMPKTNDTGIDGGIDPKQVEEKIKENPEIKLIVITSPTYEGVISNVKEICDIAHKHSIPVLVDEAHGAHIKFMEGLEKYEALKAGADIVIQSIHKTLPALTQTSIMHIQGNLVEENEVARQLSIFETSSPSYILMSSINECLEIIENRKKLFSEYRQNLQEFYSKVKDLKRLEILGNIIDKKEIYDNGKIVILTNKTNITGKQLAKILRNDYKIETEMSNVNYVISMTSICDTKENFTQLLEALKEIDAKVEEKTMRKSDYLFKLPRKELSINEAIKNRNGEMIDFKEAEGKISKEYIWIYPPGIPIIVPGEVISENIIEKLEIIMKADIEVRTTYQKFPKVFFGTEQKNTH